MKTYKITLENETAKIYEEMAKVYNKPIEFILEDMLKLVEKTVKTKLKLMEYTNNLDENQ